MIHKTHIHILLASLITLGACGGGGGGGTADSGGIGGTGVVSTGVMTKGSVILNGVKFEDNTANIVIDDTPKTAAALRDGMVVKVIGTINDDGIRGTAQRVEAEIEVRGTATDVTLGTNPQTLSVLSQDIIVDDQTIISVLGIPNATLSDISNGDLVEIHGLRNPVDNKILATRIETEDTAMGDATVDEIRGVVNALPGQNPTSFMLGSQNVNATGAVISPVGATYSDGSVVEVHCDARPCVVGGAFQASRIEVEDAEDGVFTPNSGGRLEVEGLTSGFTAHPGNFFVAGVPVTTTNSTRFAGGVDTDLTNGIKIEAEGTWDGSRLVAGKIQYKRAVVRLQGSPTTPNGSGTFDLQIEGTYTVSVETDTLTQGGLPAGGETCIQVRANRKAGVSGPVVIAGEIDASGCSSGDRHFIQAPVEAENGTTLTLLTFPINLGGVGIEFTDSTVEPERTLTSSEFFGLVTPAGTNAANVPVPGTLVKVRFDGGQVDEAEIED